jgi:general secretion pathway protein G
MRRVAPADRFGRDERGFTLLELLVVLAILGLLIGLVAPRVMHIFGQAKVQVARQQIAQLDSVLQLYKLDVGSYPTTEQGLEALLTRPPGVRHWDGPYFKGGKVPQDPWGHPYIYRNPSERPHQSYDLISLGPSGRLGGSGEIENE